MTDDFVRMHTASQWAGSSSRLRAVAAEPRTAGRLGHATWRQGLCGDPFEAARGSNSEGNWEFRESLSPGKHTASLSRLTSRIGPIAVTQSRPQEIQSGRRRCASIPRETK
jgi:hypothetical protein